MSYNSSHRLDVIQLPIDTLNPYAKNPRKHSKAQLKQLANSIQSFSFVVPVLVNKANMILAGHGRVEAAKQLGLAEVPTIRIEHLSEAQQRAYIIADNRLAENSTWDQELLALEFDELMTLDLDFNLEITGFEIPQIDLMVQDLKQEDPDTGDEVPEPPIVPVTKPGDLWQLGRHRILCGDSLDGVSYAALLGDEKAQVVFTDPPYNVKIDGHVGGLGKVKHAEFAMASGEMSQAEFTTFLSTMCQRLNEHCADGAIQFICMDWRHMTELLVASKLNELELKNLCVWGKDNGGMGSLYRSQHELVFVFKHGTAPHINNVALGKHGRYRTNLWTYRGASSLRKGRAKDLAMHPTVKPVRMVADALRDCSHRDSIVLDPFGGSGSTLIAAEQTHRQARLIELEPKYVDVTIRRWQELTGQQAVHAVTGETFGRGENGDE